MARKRVHEIAKQQGLTSKQVLAALNAAGVEAKAAASSVEEAIALKALEAANGGGAPAESAAPAPAAADRDRRSRGRARQPAAEAGAEGRRAAAAQQRPVRPVQPAGTVATRRAGRRSAAAW